MTMCTANLLLVSCFVGFALAKTEAEVKSWIMERGAMCINDFAVPDEELLLMDKHVIPESRNGKCFVACLLKKATWMDEKGMFSEENAVQMAEQDHSEEPVKIENAKKLFALCKTVNDETHSGADGECERAASLAKCLTENASKMGFKI